MGFKNNLTFRIIPCLDVKNGQVVKGINFIDLANIGSPVEIAKKYNDEGADEIIFLDITASNENRNTTIDMVKIVSKEIFIPFAVGGGIRNLNDIYNLLNAGCDKVSINSSAIKNPSLIEEGAKRFGSQCIIVAIDVKRNHNLKQSNWNVFINGGRVDTKIQYKQWVKEVESRGAGEILLTSMDNDGTKNGYDNELLSWSAENIKLPLIASGGAGTMEHIKDAYINGADAALAASIFHYKEIDIMKLKEYLLNQNIPVRI
ncbi:imidazole glycerol phosphate synthase subunit HisF [Helicobacter sp. MIT 14-3879]|uniref:imidazole glycerol phosphate synthase subunit HisF n=1 Tax=Helicobacter sp. MIT 14-3879 TaxID=2040649 RepID=UPI002162801F|nr:imidazole glycerol phosphate synthase subunit HisF [Helicobacter sp. MIT 14-3879]